MQALNPNDTPSDMPAQTLQAWYATPQGAYVLAWEQVALDKIVADIFGYFAVQAGSPALDFFAREPDSVAFDLGTGRASEPDCRCA